MAKILGPLSTAYSGGLRYFYVDCSNQLNDDESLSTIDGLTPSDSDLSISSTNILSTDVTTKDGHILPANKSIVFRAGCTVEKNKLVNLYLDYTTSDGNKDSTILKLKLVSSI